MGYEGDNQYICSISALIFNSFHHLSLGTQKSIPKVTWFGLGYFGASRLYPIHFPYNPPTSLHDWHALR